MFLLSQLSSPLQQSRVLPSTLTHTECGGLLYLLHTQQEFNRRYHVCRLLESKRHRNMLRTLLSVVFLHTNDMCCAKLIWRH